MPGAREPRQSPIPPPPIWRGGGAHPLDPPRTFPSGFAAGGGAGGADDGALRAGRTPPRGRRADRRAGRLARGPAAAPPRRAGRRRRRLRPGPERAERPSDGRPGRRGLGGDRAAPAPGEAGGMGSRRRGRRASRRARCAGLRDQFTENIDVSLRGEAAEGGGGRSLRISRPGARGTPGPERAPRGSRRRVGVPRGQGIAAADGARIGLGWGSGADRLARAVDGRVLRGPLAARTRWGGSARAGFPPRSAGACRRGPGGLSSVGGRGQAPTANSTTWAASAIWACSSTLRAMLSRTSSVQGHRPAQIARRSSPDLPITSGVKSRPL